MRNKTTLLSLLFVCLLSNINHAQDNINNRWIGELTLRKGAILPFVFQKDNTNKIHVFNADEQITLQAQKASIENDTIIYSFPDFDSELRIIWKRNKAEGYWLNKNKTTTYLVPFKAKKTEKPLFYKKSNNGKTIVISEKWKTVFSPDAQGKGEAALGVFSQKGDDLEGTFLTETGDYRFLSGNIFGNQLYLSCFDGSHAFLFNAELNNDTLKGEFHSGKGYKTNWFAVSDESFELSDPYSLTYVDDKKEALHFQFPNIEDQLITYPNTDYEGKVTIIQIMGSWCPNCIDETRYFQELYKQYHGQGLEIIMIAYEIDKDTLQYPIKLNRLKSRYKIPYEILIAGSANKTRSSEDFPMLNEIISYPTTFFIDRNGKVAKIHTGFYGPGTGDYYINYTKDTKALIETLLEQ
jgi:thiol-disulfide isomerase/thioredoxin